MILLYAFLAINFLAFIIMSYDKRQAVKGERRISEKTLLSFVLIGGTIGSGLGMLIFRHKTAKTSYLLKYWGIVILQFFIIWYYFNK